MRLLLCLGAVLGGSRAGLEAQTNGLVVAWGQNSSGQTNVPAGLSNVVAIAGGGHNSLALRSKGTVVAWGDNTSGQTNAPTGLGSFVAVAAGSSYTLTVSGGPLRVLLAPGNQTVASGHAVEFRTAVLSLPPLGYQWFFAETNSISGAMGPVLHLTGSVLGVGSLHGGRHQWVRCRDQFTGLAQGRRGSPPRSRSQRILCSTAAVTS